ncbi:hypothetical protein Fmac_007719 [Flemingia macrophylla]|uniref:Putative plant transposon protein domain-containing protein n=1 Tax=Flemingia macrophylla TaxID=520843 RepID=A0ABD1MVF7_9FABA
MARTARQARRNISVPSYRVDLNDDVDNIPEEQPFDPGFDSAYRSPPHVDSYSPGDGTQSIPFVASTGTGGISLSRGTRRKAAMVDVMDAQFDKLTTKLDAFTDYFDRGMASGSRPTRKRTSMDRKEKGTTTLDEAPRSRLPPIEAVLNHTLFFSKCEQMVMYGLGFHHRVVLAPKLMEFPYFASSGLYFHHHLEFQGLKHFVAISSSYFEDLIKVFYSNLRVFQVGYLYSEVNKTKIKMKPADWLIVAGLKYEGHKLSFTNMPEDIDYDCDIALASMIRPEMQGRNVRNVGSLNINDRLLHYVYVHISAPRSSNFAQLLQEDIFMLWAIKNNMSINCPHFIMEHMIKCRDNEMPLPYAILITHIMSHYGVDLSIDAAIDLGWQHYFYKKILKKLNVVNVNGVWQHGRINQDHGQNAEDEDQPMPEEHVADIGPQPTLQYDPQMLSQIWSGIQGLQEGLNNLNINVNSSIHGLQEGLTTLTTDVNRGFNTLHTRFDDLEKRFDDFQQSSE